MAAQAAAAAGEASKAAGRERDALSAAAAQEAANQELMARKTSVEWQLIQALASPGSQVCIQSTVVACEFQCNCAKFSDLMYTCSR